MKFLTLLLLLLAINFAAGTAMAQEYPNCAAPVSYGWYEYPTGICVGSGGFGDYPFGNPNSFSTLSTCYDERCGHCDTGLSENSQGICSYPMCTSWYDNFTFYLWFAAFLDYDLATTLTGCYGDPYWVP